MVNKEKKMEQYPMPCVGIFLFNGNRILLSKRINTPHQNGKYGLPGGKIDFGESPESAAKRELLEETGISSVIDIQPVGIITSNVYKEENKHYLCLWFFAYTDKENIDYVEMDKNGKSKNEKWEWYNTEDLPLPLVMENLKNVLDECTIYQLQDTNLIILHKEK
jgi:8-oxo-dGTP diphosphatase